MHNSLIFYPCSRSTVCESEYLCLIALCWWNYTWYSNIWTLCINSSSSHTLLSFYLSWFFIPMIQVRNIFDNDQIFHYNPIDIDAWPSAMNKPSVSGTKSCMLIFVLQDQLIRYPKLPKLHQNITIQNFENALLDR